MELDFCMKSAGVTTPPRNVRRRNSGPLWAGRGRPRIAQSPAPRTSAAKMTAASPNFRRATGSSTAALPDNNLDGVYDRLDPTIAFLVSNAQALPAGGFLITWNSIPGKNYQVQYADNLVTPVAWQDLPGGQTNAMTGQLTLSLTDNTAPSNRFYRVKFLP